MAYVFPEAIYQRFLLFPFLSLLKIVYNDFYFLYSAHILSFPSPPPHLRLKDTLYPFLQTASSVVHLPFDFCQWKALAEIRRAGEGKGHGSSKWAKSFLLCPTFVTLWAVEAQAPLSMEFSRQEYWSGLPCPSPGDLPNPGIESRSLILQMDSLPLSYWGNPKIRYFFPIFSLLY